MLNLSSISLKWKVPGVVVILCLLVASGIGLTSYQQFRTTLLHESSSRLEELIRAEAEIVEQWFENTISNVASMGLNPSVVESTKKFHTAWNNLGNNAGAQLQRLYVSQNMFPTGEKHRLDAAEDGSFYSKQHAKYHPYFRRLLDLNSYYDVFLFDAQGNLIYSVFKELDYATNFLNGPYAQSGLGRAFRQGRDAAKGEVQYVDYSSYAPSGNAPASFLSTPIFDEQSNLIGVYAIQFPIQVVQGLIDHARNESVVDNLFLIGEDGLLRTNIAIENNIAEVFSSYSTEFVDRAVTTASGIISFEASNVRGDTVVAASSNVQFLDTKWYVVAETNRDTLLAPLFQMRNVMLANGGIALLVLSLLGWLFSRSIVKPAIQLEQNLRNLVSGDFKFEINGLDRGDEFGQSAAALSDLRASLVTARELDESTQHKALEQQEVVGKFTTALLELSAGNLTYKLNEQFAPEFEPLRENFNSSLDTLNALIVQVMDSCTSISMQSGEISKSADNLSNRTENQAATLEETAAALDQLTTGVKLAAKSASEVENIVDEARNSAQTGKAIVDDAVSAMEEIEESSNQISEIITVIDDIAFQTNLLALNAGVEAGRAGDAGKGFAVVASEVGSLAQRSSDAAKAIKKLISESARQVSKGVKNVSDAGEAITTIVGRVSHISELMRETASSASEQSHSLDEINIGVNQLDQVTQENAAMVELSTEASHELSSKSEALTQTVSQFKTQSQTGLRVPTAKPELSVVENGHSAAAAKSVRPASNNGLVQIDSAANDDVWMSF